MEVFSLENIVKPFAKKHPLITAFIGLKIIDSITLAAAYMIWPQETASVIHSSYQVGKEIMPFAGLGMASCPHELSYMLSKLNRFTSYILDID